MGPKHSKRKVPHPELINEYTQEGGNPLRVFRYLISHVRILLYPSPLGPHPPCLILIILPPMPPLSFEERASSGCYDNLARIFNGSSDSLAKVDYDTHFTGKSSAWQSDGDAINH